MKNLSGDKSKITTTLTGGSYLPLANVKCKFVRWAGISYVSAWRTSTYIFRQFFFQFFVQQRTLGVLCD